ncbi:MAG: transposase, partial [Alphaproteobacteria bacterium]
FDRQVQVIAALTEGCSIRATERLTDIHRDTIMRLGVRVGEGCADLHDRMMRDLHVPILEFDEIWAYVGKKQRKAPGQPEAGDQYTYVALDATNKAIVSYMVGKRNAATTQDFVDDVWRRIANRPQITTDGYEPLH